MKLIKICCFLAAIFIIIAGFSGVVSKQTLKERISESPIFAYRSTIASLKKYDVEMNTDFVRKDEKILKIKEQLIENADKMKKLVELVYLPTEGKNCAKVVAIAVPVIEAIIISIIISSFSGGSSMVSCALLEQNKDGSDGSLTELIKELGSFTEFIQESNYIKGLLSEDPDLIKEMLVLYS